MNAMDEPARLVAELVLTLGWSYDLRDDHVADWADAIEEVKRLRAVERLAADFRKGLDPIA